MPETKLPKAAGLLGSGILPRAESRVSGLKAWGEKEGRTQDGGLVEEGKSKKRACLRRGI